MLFHSLASTRSRSPSLSMSPDSTLVTIPISGNSFFTYLPFSLMKSEEAAAIGNFPGELFPPIKKSISPSPSISNATAALGSPGKFNFLFKTNSPFKIVYIAGGLERCNIFCV